MNNSKEHTPTMYERIPAVAALNKVPGFDPLKLLRRTVSPKTKETVLQLDLPYKKLWFRLANPKGRIRLNALRITEQLAIYEAQVYLDRSDNEPIGSFTACRTREDTPDGQYIQAAQNEAVNEALSDAGYGLQFADVSMDSAGRQFGSQIPLTGAAAGVGTVPAQQAHRESVSAQKVPGEKTSAQQIPRQNVAIQEVSGASVFTQQVPRQNAVVQQVPGARMPAQPIPKQNAVVQQTLKQGMAVGQIFKQDTAIQQATNSQMHPAPASAQKNPEQGMSHAMGAAQKNKTVQPVSQSIPIPGKVTQEIPVSTPAPVSMSAEELPVKAAAAPAMSPAPKMEELPVKESAQDTLPVSTETVQQTLHFQEEDTLPVAPPRGTNTSATQMAMQLLHRDTPEKTSDGNTETADTAADKLPVSAETLPVTVNGQAEPEKVQSSYTADMPVETILEMMTFEESQRVVVDVGICNGWTIAQVAERRPASLKYYVYGGYKGNNNILRAAARMALDDLTAKKAG